MKVRYVIDVDKRTVVAIIEDAKEAVLKRVTRRLGMNVSHYIYQDLINQVKDTYVGKSKCDPNDEFNITKGKILAARRASAKFEKACCSAILKVLQPVYDEINTLFCNQISIKFREANRLIEYEYKMSSEE